MSTYVVRLKDVNQEEIIKSIKVINKALDYIVLNISNKIFSLVSSTSLSVAVNKMIENKMFLSHKFLGIVQSYIYNHVM
jgi:hypothetical protein